MLRWLSNGRGIHLGETVHFVSAEVRDEKDETIEISGDEKAIDLIGDGRDPGDKLPLVCLRSAHKPNRERKRSNHSAKLDGDI